MPKPLRHLRLSHRVFTIAHTLARYDALFLVRELGFPAPFIWFNALFRRRSKLPKGERLAQALEALGPTFIKLGQTLSTRPDLVGTEIAEALAHLRDSLPAFPGETAKRIIVAELGKPLNEIFAEFSDEAIAAASIAQVHRAKLLSGEDVAVKVLRPGIEAAFARDLELFEWGAEIIIKRFPAWRRLKPLEVVATFAQTVRLELDLRFEAAAATEMAENIKKDSGFQVPKIHWRETAQRVMVSEWLEGIAIHRREELMNAGHDPDAILARLSQNFFLHVFRDGFFHADMHPGNISVHANGNIIAVDFGIMGRLKRREREFVAQILRGFIEEDYTHVAEVHFRAGYVPQSQSVEDFAMACRAIAKPILERPLNEVSVAKLLGQLFHITETFQMETQPQLLLLQKTLVMVEGIGRQLNPNINMWEMARAPIEAWALEQASLKARFSRVREEVIELLETLMIVITRLRDDRAADASCARGENVRDN